MTETEGPAGAVAATLAHLRELERRGVRGLPPCVLPAAALPVAAERPAAAETLEAVRADLGDCQRCKLAALRKKIVFGDGAARADLVFVGEGPGANEDEQGLPFVGDAGQLLTKMIEAMGFDRAGVYICNVVKCRPPGNRDPEPDEVAACRPFLDRQLASIAPRLIVTLGRVAATTLLDRPGVSMGSLRGRFYEYQGIPVLPTYHPAYLLRTPSSKRQAWDDLKMALAKLASLGIQPPRRASGG